VIEPVNLSVSIPPRVSSAQGFPAVFSFYLTHQNQPKAELTLGGIDTDKFTGSITYSNLTLPHFWQLNSTGIYVNGKTSSVLQPKQPLQPIFDSGLSNLGFNKQLTEAIYSLISPDIKPYAPEPGAYGIPCSKLDNTTLPATIEMTFTDTSGLPFNLTIPSSELNLGPFASNTSMCQMLINEMTSYDVPVLGGSLLKHYYSVWDADKNRLGFAKSKV